MITQDMIDEIQQLKERRYNQKAVAEKLNISKSTVARYWDRKGELSGNKSATEKHDFYQVLFDLFYFSECESCGTVYPQPKFMPYWQCPGCKKQNSWPKCWYPKEEPDS